YFLVNLLPGLSTNCGCVTLTIPASRSKRLEDRFLRRASHFAVLLIPLFHCQRCINYSRTLRINLPLGHRYIVEALFNHLHWLQSRNFCACTKSPISQSIKSSLGA